MNDTLETGRISVLLEQARNGEPGALARVFQRTYDDLCRLASARLRSRGYVSALDTTALVHETFMRVAGRAQLHANDRAHFFRLAGRVMRGVIVDAVRQGTAQRRRGEIGGDPLAFDDGADRWQRDDMALRVHEALDRLADCEPRLVDVVQLRYFAGLSDREIAESLGITDRTVRRDWEKARSLLAEALAS